MAIIITPGIKSIKLKSQLKHYTMSREAGIWIRVSTEEQARGESPAYHEAMGRSYAELKGE